MLQVSIMFSRSNNIKRLILMGVVCLSGVLPRCGLNPLKPYVPVITLGAIFSPDSVFMPGNVWYPNTCTMVDDTLRMYFFTENYTVNANRVREGDQVRFDVYHPMVDSLYGKRNILLRVMRYSAGQTPAMSYCLGPSDTLETTYDIQLRIERFSRSPGDSVRMEIYSAHLPVESVSATDLVIIRGIIKGVMQ